jgi:hypothetical protein
MKVQGIWRLGELGLDGTLDESIGDHLSFHGFGKSAYAFRGRTTRSAELFAVTSLTFILNGLKLEGLAMRDGKPQREEWWCQLVEEAWD